MLSPALFPTPLLTAVLNRLWRGEAGQPKWVWYLMMVAMATGIFFSAHTNMTIASVNGLMLIWLVYFVGYAALPWQAAFSAIHGEAPGRKDSRCIQWLQTLSYAISGAPDPWKIPVAWGSKVIDLDYDYRYFGGIYGTLRAMFMLPGIFLLVHFTGSMWPLMGLVGLTMGLVYYASGRMYRHFGEHDITAVSLEEIFMGDWHGVYMLIVAASI